MSDKEEQEEKETEDKPVEDGENVFRLG